MHTLLMGILNVTPDSFSDGGQYLDPGAAAARAIELQRDGADIVDIGGESTRPGSVRISEAEELARVLPVLERVQGTISIDTRHPAVAERAIAAGANIINHVAVEGERARVEAMADLARRTEATLILMHVRGQLETMHTQPPMDDPVGETLAGLRQLRDWARLPPDRLWLDPGFGFGKNGAENFALLDGLSRFHELGHPLVVGVSRKRFLGGSDDATAQAVCQAVMARVHVVRVHNVAPIRSELNKMVKREVECE